MQFLQIAGLKLYSEDFLRKWQRKWRRNFSSGNSMRGRLKLPYIRRNFGRSTPAIKSIANPSAQVHHPVKVKILLPVRQALKWRGSFFSRRTGFQMLS